MHTLASLKCLCFLGFLWSCKFDPSNVTVDAVLNKLTCSVETICCISTFCPDAAIILEFTCAFDFIVLCSMVVQRTLCNFKKMLELIS